MSSSAISLLKVFVTFVIQDLSTAVVAVDRVIVAYASVLARFMLELFLLQLQPQFGSVSSAQQFAQHLLQSRLAYRDSAGVRSRHVCLRRFHLMQCPASTHERAIESCNWHAKEVTLALLKEFCISFISFLYCSYSMDQKVPNYQGADTQLILSYMRASCQSFLCLRFIFYHIRCFLRRAVC